MKKWLGLAVVLVACGGGGDDPAGAWANIYGFGGGTVTGTAIFDRDTDNADVYLSVSIDHCVAGKSYPVHIHSGDSCSDLASQGGHWDMSRGEGIPNIVCDDDSTGSTDYTRRDDDPSLAWSIGDSPETGVAGHTIVVHDPDDAMKRIACGTIKYLYPI